VSTTADLSPHNDSRTLAAARDLRRTCEARIKFWRVLIVSTFFVIVLGGNLFVGAVLMFKTLHTGTTETPASFRIGRITFPLLDGVFCRHILIDNETAPTKEEKISRCDSQDPVSSRVSTRFAWGGQ
jgi:hypothetical protein